MLRDVLATKCKALAAWVGVYRVSLRRAYRVVRVAISTYRYRSESGSLGPRCVADSRNCRGPRALWISQDPGAAEARGLERGQEAVISVVSRRGPDAALQAATAKVRGNEPTGACQGHRTESGVELGRCSRPTGGRTEIWCFDGHGCVHARESDD